MVHQSMRMKLCAVIVRKSVLRNLTPNKPDYSRCSYFSISFEENKSVPFLLR
jgi:hypothetical protein